MDRFLSDVPLLIVSGVCFLLVILVVILFCLVIADRKKLNRINTNCKTGNLDETIVLYYNKLDSVSKRLDSAMEKADELERLFKSGVFKLGYMRYDAFAESSNELSYSFAILDDKDCGFVVTGIFGRNISNTYLKPIVSSRSTVPLSEEEERVIEFAKADYIKKMSH